MEEEKSIVWSEKWRPKKLEDVCGQEHVKKDLLTAVKRKDIPHLLFYGVPGVGKTTTAIAIAKEILGDFFAVNFTELNASDERGIQTVREKVKYFAMSSPINAKFKIILLDECDSLTDDAQNALRRIMEKYSGTCRFILCCNTLSKMIPPIQSRCVSYNFLPLRSKEIENRLKYICENEGVKYDEKALTYLSEQVDGDIRAAVEKLQSIACSTDGELTIDSIQSDKLEGTFLYVVKSIFMDRSFSEARVGIQQLLYEGLAPREVILKLHNYILRQPRITNTEKIPKLVRIFREAERDLILGVNYQIELDAFLYDMLECVK